MFFTDFLSFPRTRRLSGLAAVGTACTERELGPECAAIAVDGDTVILVWRTYALWNQSKKILIGLGVMWTVSLLASGCMLALTVKIVMGSRLHLPCCGLREIR